MPDPQDNTPLPEAMAKSLAAFSRVMALLPGNVLHQSFTGPLAAMELVRITQTVVVSGGGVARSNGREVIPFTQAALAPEKGWITLDGQGFRVEWVVFQRPALMAFDHILAGLTPREGGGETAPWILCADRSPLLEPEGLRLTASHLARMGSNGRGEDLRKELDGISAMLSQGNPFGGGGEEA